MFFFLSLSLHIVPVSAPYTSGVLGGPLQAPGVVVPPPVRVMVVVVGAVLMVVVVVLLLLRRRPGAGPELVVVGLVQDHLETPTHVQVYKIEQLVKLY